MSSAWQASHTQGAIRVVHLLAPVDSGGGEALLADLLRQPSPGLDAAVATLGTAPGLADELNKNGIECFSLGQRLVGQIRGGKIRETIVGAVHVHQWVSLISRLRPHVVHAHGYPASFLVAAAKCDVRKVYTHHYERHPPRSLERQALTQTYNRYDLLTSPAQHLSAALTSMFPGLVRPFIHVRSGISDEFFQGRSDQSWRHQFPSDSLIGVCVGRMIPSKNQELIVRSIASMNATERRRFQVLLVGSGPSEKKLRQAIIAAKLQDNITVLGQIDRFDLPNLLASADFGIFPSLTEASSIAAAEALASGLPIVALDIPAMRETVGHAGVLSSERQFAQAIIKMGEAYGELKPLARHEAEKYRLKVARQTWQDIYNKLAEPRVS